MFELSVGNDSLTVLGKFGLSVFIDLLLCDVVRARASCKVLLAR